MIFDHQSCIISHINVWGGHFLVEVVPRERKSPIYTFPRERKSPIYTIPRERKSPIYIFPRERKWPIYIFPRERKCPIHIEMGRATFSTHAYIIGLG